MSCTCLSPWNLISFFRHQSRAAHWKMFCAVLSLLLTCAVASPAQTFTSLLSFDATNGAYPYYVYLVQGVNGQLYGTTYGGGAYSSGTVFEITTGGTITTLYSFCAVSNCTDGAEPAGGLVLATNGNFYGTTENGGTSNQGTVFEITPAGKLTTLHSFIGTDGANPYVGLIQATNGNFYGTTTGGGAGVGTLFEITPAGKLTSLHSFNVSDGQYPDARLVQGFNGLLYGTTYGIGNAFDMSLAGKFTDLVPGPGGGPTGALIQATNGNFYGTTTSGGTKGAGSVYEMTPGGKVTTLYSFCSLTNCADGETPWAGVIQANDGNLYGTTSAGGANSGGTVFQLTLNGTLTTLYNFCAQTNCTDGTTPYEGLVQNTNGILYGTTHLGGTSGYGVIYSESVPGLTPFVTATPASGKVAAKVTILGTNLTGATAVSFNGTAATFTVASGGASINTTVPAGATTGPIKVTTPGGTLATIGSFKVTPQLQTFSPPSGPVGTVVTITGVSLIQTKSVTFGGVKAASFTVNSDTQVTATVPTGAKTGKIVITTPGGTASSATSFTVTP